MLEYRSELEQCFSVVKTGADGREIQVFPREETPVCVAQLERINSEDHIRYGVSSGEPGSRQRVEDLARYYNEQENEESAFDEPPVVVTTREFWNERPRTRTESIYSALQAFGKQSESESED
jgi:hypothetical protein